MVLWMLLAAVVWGILLAAGCYLIVEVGFKWVERFNKWVERFKNGYN